MLTDSLYSCVVAEAVRIYYLYEYLYYKPEGHINVFSRMSGIFSTC